jgi:hypothetical protein
MAALGGGRALFGELGGRAQAPARGVARVEIGGQARDNGG